MSNTFWTASDGSFHAEIERRSYRLAEGSGVHRLGKVGCGGSPLSGNISQKDLDILDMIRKARIDDVVEIQQMLRDFAAGGSLLPRSLSELYTTLRDLVVFEDETGRVAGCCGLHIIWADLAEIRSLAVVPSLQRRGIGRRLVEACIAEAKSLGIHKLFALTYEVDFFGHLGFRLVEKDMFPQKVWADCIHCPKFPNCDESALMLDIA